MKETQFVPAPRPSWAAKETSQPPARDSNPNSATSSAPARKSRPNQNLAAEAIRNADNADLQPLAGPNFRIGLVEVNGEGAREVPEFIPTRAELVELAKHYESIFLDCEFFSFWSGQIGSTDMRLRHFARRRVGRIVELVGSDAAAPVEDARNEFAKTVDARKWKRFCRYLGIRPVYGTADKNGGPTTPAQNPARR
jgi:hypothetical protein